MANHSVKYATPAQANAMLPEVLPLIDRMMKVYQAAKLVETVQIAFESDQQTYTQQIRQQKELHRLWLEIYELIDKLADKGIVVKDMATGLIDWYAQRGGEDIFLCFRFGETRVKFWHKHAAGFQGRHAISWV